MEPNALLLGVLLPSVLTGTVLLVAWRLPARDAPARHRIEPLPLAAAFAFAQVGLVGWPPFPPVSGADAVLLAAAATALLALAEGGRTRSRETGAILVFLAAFGVPAILLHNRLGGWGAIGSAVRLLTVGGTALISVAAVRRSTRLLPSPAVASALLVSTSAVSFALLFGASALLAQFTGALAASLGAVLVGTLWKPSAGLSHSAALVVVPMGCGLLAIGVFSAYLPPICAGLVAASFVAPLAFRATSGRPRFAAIRSAAAALVPAAIGVGIALRQYLSEEAY